jgi:hypoxanthine phosphoribosyltransferase
MAEREILTWELFGSASRELAQTIADSGFRPDVVLGIARGGLVPAGSLAYALDCKNLFTMNVEFYTGVGTTLDAPVMLPPLLVFDFCRGHVAEVRTAVLYEKPRSVIKADYTWRHTDRWINFPWSAEPPVVTRTGVVDS